MKTVSFQMSEDLHRELVDYCGRAGLGKSQVMRRALEVVLRPNTVRCYPVLGVSEDRDRAMVIVPDSDWCWIRVSPERARDWEQGRLDCLPMTVSEFEGARV